VEIGSAAVEIVSSNSKTASLMLTKRLHNGGNVQRKFQEMLMAANSQTTIIFLTTRDNGMME
jgi:hypothetical protein